ncbi:MAG TPA: ADP-forming succinate--CoA ligase subunit beta [Candidatus Saccharicenans sp.]|jgi:succinyl-CoA synthetase beta subunit|nr:ADP-forming succinate--CoA ligase subunit beta [Candidatus Saccharicenans sp.]HRD01224.1 ADP-forming succinate--CoA ligase subunit beta [Candidatus Saccharicenans sp.]
MLIYEFQAKALLKELGVAIPAGYLAETADEVRMAAEKLGGQVILKAQILSGGRAKAGGIVVVDSSDQAELAASQLLHRKLITAQSGGRGLVVKKLLVEELVSPAREIYLSLVVDRKNEKLAALASPQGGVEIEELSKSSPQAIKKEYFCPERGLMSFQIRNLAYFLDLPEATFKTFLDYLKSLSTFFLLKDMKLLEINPLIVKTDNQLVAADIKMDFDDSGLARQPEISSLEDWSGLSAEEKKARSFKLNYVKMEGHIGCLVNGAGLAMATMDIIKLVGGEPANFLDIGGGVTEEAVGQAFEILASDQEVKACLVNIFGGIVRCDLVARGLVASARKFALNKPVVVRLQGTNETEGRKILGEANLPFYFVNDFEQAARLVVNLSQP